MNLYQLFDDASKAWPDNTAVVEPGVGSLTYAELRELVGSLAERLRQAGVAPGHRVGICLPKSIDSLTCLLATLRIGAAYVPVDSTAPAERNAYIFDDCAVTAYVTTRTIAESLSPLITRPAEPLLIDATGAGNGIRMLTDPVRGTGDDTVAPVAPSELAYILYTSGSTGKPKGVKISHRAATRFVIWCANTFTPVPGDRFSSHAPFHFDLSILDIYASLMHGAALVLIPEATGKEPMALAELIESERISVWYSAPSILALLAQYGNFPQRDLSALRLVLFAGEVFPVKHLHRLHAQLPEPRYFNLYGPTETNVCTYLELPGTLDPSRQQPYPIGKACEHYEIALLDEAGASLAPDAEGELCVLGDGVMDGYWNRDDLTDAAFHVDAAGQHWYRTGDIVAPSPDGYVYLGRRDRMVKKRGYRVELGEIENALYRNPDIAEAAVIATHDDDKGTLVRAFLVAARPDSPLSIIAMKRFCAQHLPNYMIPDFFTVLDQLPKTSTDKTDYQGLVKLANP